MLYCTVLYMREIHEKLLISQIRLDQIRGVHSECGFTVHFLTPLLRRALRRRSCTRVKHESMRRARSKQSRLGDLQEFQLVWSSLSLYINLCAKSLWIMGILSLRYYSLIYLKKKYFRSCVYLFISIFYGNKSQVFLVQNSFIISQKIIWSAKAEKKSIKNKFASLKYLTEINAPKRRKLCTIVLTETALRPIWNNLRRILDSK